MNILTEKGYIKVSKKQIKLPAAAEIADLCQTVIDAGKGENIVKISAEELSVLADYYILCTANSEPHLRAISERLKREVSRKYSFKPKLDGAPTSQWIVMDFGNVVVHILSPEMREHYQLESLWADAPSSEQIEKLADITEKAE